MSDRILSIEHPFLAADYDRNTGYTNYPSGYRQLDAQTFVHETRIDLTGYAKDDMTVYFRNGFEQKGGQDTVVWNSYDAKFDAIAEVTLVSSVPFTDSQLLLTIAYQPGFIMPGIGVDFGNFDRTHIIYGRFEVKYANSVVGSTDFSAGGFASLMNAVDNNFSSLEPTAADCLYCYRVLYLPTPGDTDITQVAIPAKRVLLSTTVDKEEELPYMMRLKRSYELANQV